ncbi:MAG: hypothetical protein GTO30_21020 [Acidobacteria bacterium]|nr:hypothetical protein [Acidobacteriota bacterium]NIM64036.1 hypothetical protein [Acidobacteriota bacterium]NIQ85353.1 hypothetical protein [Acidobacteriota bacterium]NIT11100.1 hypothetical protein [Acidobacteriota bacterium]
MKRHSHVLVVGAALYALVASASPPVADNEAVDPSKHFTIPRVPYAPELEDFLDMRGPDELTGVMAHVDTFVQTEPQDGAPASQETDVYLGYDDNNIYVVFIAFDEEPDRVRAHMARRENIFGDDIVEIQLDTFLDRQRAFSFIVNPLGVQLDALWTEGGGGPGFRGFDTSWDTVWQSRGKLTDHGYVVWMAIPFRSLRFPPNEEQTWGVVLVRDVQRTDEETFWPPISTRIEGRLNQAGTMDGLRGISNGGQITTQLIPYGTARTFEAIEETGDPFRASEDLEADIGLDAKIVFDDRLALDLTANPDFSQVESDLPQVTVNQRFEVFFPEKRPFFLENTNYFQMPINLLFTRRIADPRAGARLTGKIGKYALAAMVIDDESPGKSIDPADPLYGEKALFSVLRASRDIGVQSNVGVFYSDRELAGLHNRVFSADSRIKLDDNWTTLLQAVSSWTDTGTGTLSDEAFNFQFDRSGRHYGAHIHYRDLGPDFETQTGFVERTDLRDLHTHHFYTFRPEGKRLLTWQPRLFASHIEDHRGVRLEYSAEADLEFEFRRSTELTLSLRRGEETLRPLDLDLLVDPIDPLNPPVFTSSLDFDSSEGSLDFETNFIAAVSLEARFAVGETINFVPVTGALPAAVDRTFGRLEATLRPSTPTRLALTYLSTRLSDQATGAGVLTNRIGRLRFDWQITPKWSVRAITEHRATDVNPALTRLDTDRRFSGDLLATYLVNPWTALYVGYNSSHRNRDLILDPLGNFLINTGTSLNKDAEQLFVKFSYLFQL